MMNPFILKPLQALILVLLQAELQLFVSNSWTATGSEVRCKERERQALLEFKAGLVDGHGLLSSWGSEEEKRECCNWDRVRCSNQTGHVQVLDLHGEYSVNRLKGKIQPSLLELQHLKSLNLSQNDFTDCHIPDFFGSLSNLRYLDLSYSFFQGKIPYQLGSLSHLRHLDLYGNSLEGVIPYQLGNLPQLRYLDLSKNFLEGILPHQLGKLSSLQNLYLGSNVALTIDDKAQWLSNLSSLTHLDLSTFSNLNSSHNWMQMIGKLKKLKGLWLSNCGLTDLYLPSKPPSKINFSASLAFLDLSSNKFKNISSIFPWVFNSSSNLVELYLNENLLEGSIPNAFGNMINSLEYLDLHSNKLQGGIPKSIGNICTFVSLDLSNNSLSEELSVIIQNLLPCARYSLQALYLNENKITGTLSDLSIFPSLRTLDISQNQLNGRIPEGIRLPSQLESLSIKLNSLEGLITDSHVANMSKLKTLDLSYNSLALRFSRHWVPSFELEELSLASCKLGTDFPKWLQAQKTLVYLDISNAGISDIVPEWFWAQSTKLNILNISYNSLIGTIPNLPLKFIDFPYIIMTSNHFEGPIPPFLRGASSLYLSKNKFSESRTFLCANNTAEMLGILDLSDNQLTGQLPDCWSHFKSLVYLDLSNNNLSENVPPSMGSLTVLQALILRNNSLIGELPSSLKSCTNLGMLDVGENRLSGPIPSWIGNGLQQLLILSLRRNHFFGRLPLHLCKLTRLQLLDLSLNSLSGRILKCLKNFTALTQKSFLEDQTPSYSYVYNYGYRSSFAPYDLNPLLMWKGVEQRFKNNGLLLKSIDLSSNQLTGGIPADIGNLAELVSLNLSRNNLTGVIPSDIGSLVFLEFLDLSRNHFLGSIPTSLAQIDRLTMLDLSHNHLSGEIPTGTQLQSFNASCYEENLDLCGKPLEKMCPNEEPPQEPRVKFKDQHSLFSQSFYVSMGLGFITGFWGIFGSILFNRSWRHAYFRFLNKLTDNIYVMTTVNVAKFHRWLKG